MFAANLILFYQLLGTWGKLDNAESFSLVDYASYSVVYCDTHSSIQSNFALKVIQNCNLLSVVP